MAEALKSKTSNAFARKEPTSELVGFINSYFYKVIIVEGFLKANSPLRYLPRHMNSVIIVMERRLGLLVKSLWNIPAERSEAIKN